MSSNFVLQFGSAGVHVIPETQERLDGWKSIAGYLKPIRTVQRWEKLEGLPVHRIGHASSASVFAYPGELDLWWNERKSRIDDPSEPATALVQIGSGGDFGRDRCVGPDTDQAANAACQIS